jgi:RsiW-degrading membrane proteinase PrsW (M82 family)
MIPVRCEACGGAGKAPDRLAGKVVPCPKCGAPLPIPNPEGEMDDVPLLLSAEAPAQAPREWVPAAKKPMTPERERKKKGKRAKFHSGPERLWWLYGLVLLPIAALLLRSAEMPRVEANEDGDITVTVDRRAAALPSDTMLHWPMGVAAGAALVTLAVLVFPRGDTPILNIAGMAAGAALVGIATVFAILFFSHVRYYIPPVLFPVWLFSFVTRMGMMLEHDPEGGLLQKIIGSALGTGLPEELAKLTLLLFLAHQAGTIDWRRMRIMGIASGIGFGSAEAILYANNLMNGAMGWEWYAARFISCAGFHGILSGVAALLVYRFAEQLDAGGFARAFWKLIQIVAVAAVLHGIYNGSLGADQRLPALAANIAALLLLGWMSNNLRKKDG